MEETNAMIVSTDMAAPPQAPSASCITRCPSVTRRVSPSTTDARSGGMLDTKTQLTARYSAPTSAQPSIIARGTSRRGSSNSAAAYAAAFQPLNAKATKNRLVTNVDTSEPGGGG